MDAERSRRSEAVEESMSSRSVSVRCVWELVLVLVLAVPGFRRGWFGVR